MAEPAEDRPRWWLRPLDRWAGRGLLAFFLFPLGTVGMLIALKNVVTGDGRGGRLLGIVLAVHVVAALAVVVRIVQGRAATWHAVLGIALLYSAGRLLSWMDSVEPEGSWVLAGLTAWLVVNRVRQSRTAVAPPAEAAADVSRP
ncbi:hypothetical protein [Kineosporia sp. A_224]|uniref:hypothetical protein n=1 Tax=Kineosporia sp. A_224 TaxID=1962180 RepID=UPI000B4C0255|nr:hypothetical protein [Kineosporia sp. A_224]